MLLSLSLLLACPKETPVEAAAPAVPVLPDYATTVLADMDASADPCDNFYQYACGGWQERTVLPADKSSWTRSFSEIAEQNRTFLKAKLEAAAADPTAGDENWAKLGTAYGESDYSPVHETEFKRRRRRRPDGVLTLHYDSRDGLKARGVIPTRIDPYAEDPYAYDRGGAEDGFAPAP